MRFRFKRTSHTFLHIVHTKTVEIADQNGFEHDIKSGDFLKRFVFSVGR